MLPVAKNPMCPALCTACNNYKHAWEVPLKYNIEIINVMVTDLLALARLALLIESKLGYHQLHVCPTIKDRQWLSVKSNAKVTQNTTIDT